VKLLAWADEHPVATTSIVAALMFLGLRAWSLAEDDPVLLADADADQRVTIYGQVAGSAVAVLGISLTVLAILIAPPIVRSSTTSARATPGPACGGCF
jgi:hypothetical protein